ncbi:MAG TPA: maleylacetoacetate isomerase [Polyangia bacterium]|jgi:maleylpyruvate isomerase|nr:maleylacetoacetate isomerase [Polyangia bacterium]
MKLYGYWRSSSAWRVRIALGLKGIQHDYEAVRLAREGGQQHEAPFTAKNPLAQVPLLELDARPGEAAPRRIAQSMAILEFLEEHFPTPALLPADPWLRARARQLAEVVNSGIQPYQNMPLLNYVKDVLGGDEMAAARFFNHRGLTALETLAKETAGDFLVGNAPTFADVYLVPQMYSARRFSLDVTSFPTLSRVEAACAALPAIHAAHPDQQADKPATG